MPKLAKPLTPTELENKSAPKKGKTYRKPDGNGLWLEIRPSGKKTWIVRARLPNGRQTPAIAIGHYPADIPITGLSLAQARIRAMEIHRDAKHGLPLNGLMAQKQGRRSALAEKEAEVSLAALEVERHCLRVVSTKWLSENRSTWQAETYRKAKLVVESYLVPKLGHLDMRSLTTKDVKPILLEMADKTPVLARKAKQYIQRIVSCAIDEGMRSDDQVLRLNGVLPKHKGGHLPAITESASDLAALMRAIDAYDSPVVVAALKLAIYTAVRPGVIASARWAEMDIDATEWRIPGMEIDGRNRMKTGEDFSTSLSAQALSAIQEMLPFTGGKEYVFPPLAKQRTAHLHRDSLSSALRKMGFQGKHTTHGCRATLRSIGRERLDIDIDVLETQLAHAPKNEVDAAYVRIKFKEQRRKVLQTWADYLDEIKMIEE